MSKFHKVKIKRINRETHDCVTVSLDVPEELKDTFRYTQGQYLTFRRQFNDEELRRSYSICSSPLENEWKVAIKKVPEGVFSSYANEALQVGEELEVMPPMGRFYTELNPENEKLYVMFAAGSGITPVLSIMKTILMTEPKSQVYLIYGNKGRNSIIFKEEIEGLKNKYMDRLSVYHILSREHGDTELFFGRIDKEKTKVFLDNIIEPDQIDECFICGPEEMIFGVKDALLEAGVDSKKVHFELFTTGDSGKKESRKDRPAGEADKQSKVTVKTDGVVMNLDMSYYGNTILDAAIEMGADLPYSCKGGVCSTCRARVIEGEVEMDVNYSLEPEEVQAGYILTCQARPLTEKVIVDFDQ
ncbi:phenylacetate-CoA oxygenase/reductase subunit PaaK [Pontibacter diazotrophicus]|uniref:Phenylacetate-CoA oxygenase/reductase subunit PaaK n=1 Tax=Pontibacter diazotrophicus TaxID=1400979 RepID=A0A3D8LDA0_9BACT|nr:1,2-phenylacetyl-CoA epoxidase subunit PaaE [Pontibacter diazotrophicus]RDV15388.1 phenylacetate-CoA oxygenase/reductase subunit PaaK [Pontibacter diazotrophicus]